MAPYSYGLKILYIQPVVFLVSLEHVIYATYTITTAADADAEG